MMKPSLGLAVLVALAGVGGALAQTRPQQPAQPQAQPAQRQQGQTQTAPVAANPLGAGGTGPLQIDSDRLEVRDRDKQAIFSGNVVATRGEAMVRASVMTVFYESEARPSGNAPAAPPPGGQQQGQQIRRIEMTGPVFFCQRTQTARGDRAVYNRVDETLVMIGNVVLTDGPENVVSGPRLVVNLRTNQAQVTTDPAQPGVRIRTLIGGAGQQAQPPPAPQRAARPGQQAPQRPC